MTSKKLLRTLFSVASGVATGLLYGLFATWVFNDAGRIGSNLLSTMTCGFLFIVPFVIGALTVYFSPTDYRHSPYYTMMMPWLSCALVIAIVGLLEWEATICLIMAIPVFFPIASFGGRTFRIKLTTTTNTQTITLGILILAPYLITPLEMALPQANDYRLVENSIIIDAPVTAVWQEIITVPLITPEEQGFSLFHWLGLPQPLEATLSHEGVGGVRQATFENGLTFVETVTEWQHHDQFSFAIVKEDDPELPAPLNQIGGDYFDVLEGTYVIEPLDDGRVRLHLSSQHRLSTRFNFYGGLWTDTIMRDLQAYILRIIKARAETYEGTPP